MDRQQKRSEKKVRKIAARGDGRALLDAALGGDGYAVETVLNEMGAAGVGLLRNALSVATTDDEVQLVLQKLGHTGDAGALDTIQGMMSHPSPSIRELAVRRLAQSGNDGHVPAIMEMLSDPSPEVRDAALEVLDEMAGPYSARHLPAGAAEIIAAAHERKAAEDREARERKAAEDRAARAAAIAAPLTNRSAAILLLGLCGDIDRTYAEPISPEAEEVRRELRDDVVRIGERLYDQGGEGLMLEVAQLVQRTSSHAGFVSREWSGIGGWMG